MKTENSNIETENTAVAVLPAPAAPETSPAPEVSGRRRTLLAAAAAIALIAGLAAGIVPRLFAQEKLATATRQVILPTVSVIEAARLNHTVELSLPGETRAYQQTEIFARADGYLLKWNTDIGTKVNAGQVLAEIDTPELDQELIQSRAQLAQAGANLALAKSSAERWQVLLKEHAVSQQEVDERNGALAARDADVQAARAAVSRLENLASFKQVRAPFAGIITRRFVDTGALIRAGGNGDASALFALAQMDTLRIHVNVPQAYLRDITVGSPVKVQVAEFPDRVFTGKVVRTSGAFDPASRTLLTEIEVANADGALFSGIHVDADLSLSQAAPPLVVPATSVIIGSNGPQVAVVDRDNSIRLHKVQVGRDLGKTMEIVGGLEDGARIVTNPTDTLVDGTHVQIAGEPAVHVALQ